MVLPPLHRGAVPRRWIVLRLRLQNVVLQRAACKHKAICVNVLALKWRRGAVVSEFSSETAKSGQTGWLVSWSAAQRLLVIADRRRRSLIEQKMELYQEEASVIVELTNTRSNVATEGRGFICFRLLPASERERIE